MKKGFTLVELLAVIAIVAILAAFIAPNLSKLFVSNKNALSDIQKKQIEDAVNIYVSDYCLAPISSSYRCPDGWELSLVDGELIVSTATLSMENLASSGYIDSEALKKNCSGNIIIEDGKIDLSNVVCNF